VTGLIVDTITGNDRVTLESADGNLDFDGPITVNADTISLDAGLLASGGSNITLNGAVDMTSGDRTLIGNEIRLESTLDVGSNRITIASTGDSEIVGDMTGAGNAIAGGLLKQGPGELTISGDGSAFTGASLLQGGSLIVNGSVGGDVRATNNSVVGGEGTIFGDVILSGAGDINPGDSGNGKGTLTVSDTSDLDTEVRFTANSTFTVDLTGAAGVGTEVAGTHYDQLRVLTPVFTSTVDLAGATLELNVDPSDLDKGDTFTILDLASGTVSGTFAGLADDTSFIDAATNQSFTINYNGGDGNDVVLTANGTVETLVSFDGAGNLVVEDISSETADNLQISQNFSRIIIKDVTPGTAVVLGTSIAGATMPDPNTVIIDLLDPDIQSQFTGNTIVVKTENTTTDAANHADDTLTVDYTTGFLSKIIDLDGGDEDTAGDQLIIANGNFVDVTHNMTGAGSGTLDFGPVTQDVTYSGLELQPVDLSTSSTEDVTLNLPNGVTNEAELVELGGGLAELRSTSSPATFLNTRIQIPPAGQTLAIIGGSGTDTVTVSS
jgi:autotransporter-associated beta strand protein